MIYDEAYSAFFAMIRRRPHLQPLSVHDLPKLDLHDMMELFPDFVLNPIILTMGHPLQVGHSSEKAETDYR